MHGEQENSKAPRITCTVLHVAFLGMAAWIYFGGGIEFITAWVGSEPKVSGNLARRTVLFSFSVVLFLRICLTLFYLLKRPFFIFKHAVCFNPIKLSYSKKRFS